MAIQKRTIGGVTTASSAGAGLGLAVAEVLAHLFPGLAGIEMPLSIIITVLFGLVAGWLVPPKQQEVVEELVEELDIEDMYEPYTPGKHAEELGQ